MSREAWTSVLTYLVCAAIVLAAIEVARMIDSIISSAGLALAATAVVVLVVALEEEG